MATSKQTGRSKCFRKRDRWMVKLGFGSYQNYLHSSTWKRIRKEVLEKRHYKCAMCGGCANQVHHLRYTKPVLLGEGDHYLGGLVAICDRCHYSVSMYAKANKIHEQYAYDLARDKAKSHPIGSAEGLVSFRR